MALTMQKRIGKLGKLKYLYIRLFSCLALCIVCTRYHALVRILEWPQRISGSHPVTLVTAYYPLTSGSKHSLDEYMEWTSNFFAHTRAPIQVYLPPGNISNVIREMRGDLPLTIKVTDFWNVPPTKKHRASFEGEQHAIDPEKHYHSPALYCIWASKSWMLQQTAQQNPFASSVFFWVDAGAWRDRPFPSFPDFKRVHDVFSRAPDRMLLGSPILQPNGRPYIQGTFFGGSQAIIDWWAREYYRLLDDWVEQHRFAGKDQDLMIDIFERYPDRFLLLRSHEYAVGDAWFFFQPFLAADADLTEDERSVRKLLIENGSGGDNVISLAE